MAPRPEWERFWTCRSRGREIARPFLRIRITTRAAGGCSISSITTPINRARPRLTTFSEELNRVLFSGPDLVSLADRQHKHATVADFAGPRRLDDGLDCFVCNRIVNDDFDLHLWQQAHVVFLPAV